MIQNYDSEIKFSLNKLVEYAYADARRQERILLDQKFPNSFKQQYYRSTREAIIKHFTDGLPIEAAMTKLEEKEIETEQQAQKRSNNLQRLEAFLDLDIKSHLEKEGFSNLHFEAPRFERSRLFINAISVSIAPELIIRATYRGESCYGGLKLYLSKGHPLGTKGYQGIAVLLQKYLNEKMPNARIHKKLCLSVIPYDDSIVSAPKAHKRIYNNIEAACDAIARQWHQLV